MGWLRQLFSRRRRYDELSETIREHLDEKIADLMDRGMTREEAEQTARREFGNVTRIEERGREVWQWPRIESVWADIRFALRQLIKSPGFAISAVLTLALGIGVNTTIFSAVSAILLRKPPVKDPDTLCAISSKNILRGYDLAGVTAPDFESWQKQNDVFEQMAAAEVGRSFTLTGKSDPESLHGDRVTSSYFAVIGVAPMLGRPFLASEDQPGKNYEVILSNSLWRDRFDGNSDAIGQDLEIDSRSYKIIGVMPPLDDLTARSQPQLWMPLVFDANDLTSGARANHYLDLVLGRLSPGVTLAHAQVEMDSIGKRLAQQYPTTNKDWGITVLTLQEFNIRGEDVRSAMILIMTAVCLVLLIACANISGLLLTRGTSRAHELAVRSALGASRARILRQLLVENALIGTAGGSLALLISVCGIRLLKAGFDFSEFGQRMAAGFRIDIPTLLFMLVTTFLATIFFGLLPALRSSKAVPRETLSETSRTASGGQHASRLRRVFVVAEISVAVILLAAAGVVLREVLRELNTPNGFNPDHLLIAKLDVSSTHYKQPDARTSFYAQVVNNVKNLPGVENADVDSCVPMGCYFSMSFDIEGRPAPSPSERPSSNFYVVGPNYFRTMQIPVLRGRGFSDDDNTQVSVVAVANEEFVRRFFPNEDAIGKQIEVQDGNHKLAQIVGIVGNVSNYVGQLHPDPQLYESYLQIPFQAFSSMSLVVRSDIPQAELTSTLRKAVWSVDKAQPVGITTMEDLANDNFGGDKLMVGLMGLFAALALGLAFLGIYGVIAYSVAQRTREIGIRVALGAKKKDVLVLILREGGSLILIGCTVGTLVALLLPKLVREILSGIAPQGPLAVFAAAVIVTLAACPAIYIPARRAASVDPMQALRSE
ncbi:MAG: ABC transporter permease [Bryobacteraceae bacterium]